MSNKFLLLVAGILLFGGALVILVGDLDIASAVEFDSHLSLSSEATKTG